MKDYDTYRGVWESDPLVTAEKLRLHIKHIAKRTYYTGQERILASRIKRSGSMRPEQYKKDTAFRGNVVRRSNKIKISLAPVPAPRDSI